MPVKIFGKTFHSHQAAAKEAKKKGVGDPDAYVATVERRQKKRKGK